MRLIDADALFDSVTTLEAVALEQVGKFDPHENRGEWLYWTGILNERTAFKMDLLDAPTIDAVEVARWIPVTERLPEPYTNDVLVTIGQGKGYIDVLNYDTPGDGIYEVKWYKTDPDGYPIIFNDVVAWMDIKPWKGGAE